MSKLSPATTRDRSGVTGRRRAVVVVSVLALVVVAACLRPPLTSLGPVVGRVGAETGLDSSELGLLGSLPIVGFAVVSPFVFHLGRALGQGRLVLAALVLLAIGLGLRFVPAVAPLWIGTAIVGVAIAVGNVMLPSLVKRDFPHRIPLMTGIYSAALGGFAALGSGLSVPVADLTGSWRASIGCWILVVAAAIVVWTIRMRLAVPAVPHAASAEPPARGPSVWSSPTAWYVTAYMGLQSTGFYVTVTWLPSIQMADGVPEQLAGWHLFTCQVVGLVSGVVMSLVLGRTRDQRLVAAASCAPVVVGFAGLAAAPEHALLWIVLIGFSQGATLNIALAIMGLRTASTGDTARLSGMSQGVGYALAAVGPALAGAVHDAAADWEPVLWILTGIALLQLLAGLGAGRPVIIGRTEGRRA